MVTMLSITSKLRALVGELESAIHVCDDLLGTLESCQVNQLTNCVGVFARQMPDYKIMREERQEAIDIIRQVCTQEMSVNKAKEIISKARAELENTRKLIHL